MCLFVAAHPLLSTGCWVPCVPGLPLWTVGPPWRPGPLGGSGAQAGGGAGTGGQQEPLGGQADRLWPRLGCPGRVPEGAFAGVSDLSGRLQRPLLGHKAFGLAHEAPGSSRQPHPSPTAAEPQSPRAESLCRGHGRAGARGETHLGGAGGFALGLSERHTWLAPHGHPQARPHLGPLHTPVPREESHVPETPAKQARPSADTPGMLDGGWARRATGLPGNPSLRGFVLETPEKRVGIP